MEGSMKGMWKGSGEAVEGRGKAVSYAVRAISSSGENAEKSGLSGGAVLSCAVWRRSWREKRRDGR